MTSKDKHTISVAIATFNEEANISKCLNSLKDFADEVVVVDGSSADKTAEIAKKYGAKVIKTSNKKMFHKNKNLAIANCKSNWILLLDADERVSRELTLEIKKTIRSNPNENGFWISRKNWFLGGFILKGGVYPDRVIRLFKRGTARLPEVSVHEQLKVTGETGRLKNDLIHFADPSFSRYLQRSDRYSSLSAQQLAIIDPGKGFYTIFIYLFFKPLITFINIFIRHQGYRDGFRGFIWALFSSSQHYLTYSKYWQIKYGRQKLDEFILFK